MLRLNTLSARRYRVRGRLPAPSSEAFLQRLHDRRFLPLTANEEQTFGWVDADNLLVTDFEPASVWRCGRAVFALRIDRRRVDARLLRAQIDLEIRARRKAAADDGRAFRLSRDERRAIRTDLEQALLRETSPSVQAHAVVLDPKAGVLLHLTRNKRAGEILRRLVPETFGVELEALTPWRRGSEILAGSPRADLLESLDRTAFASGREEIYVADRGLATPRRHHDGADASAASRLGVASPAPAQPETDA